MLLQDIVECLPNRRFRLCGRNSDQIEIAGKRASLADLTRRLQGIDGVVDAALIQPDGEAHVRRLIAFVVGAGFSAGLLNNSRVARSTNSTSTTLLVFMADVFGGCAPSWMLQLTRSFCASIPAFTSACAVAFA